MKASCLVIVIIAFNLAINGQEGQELNREIGISVFVIESNSETLNGQIEPKFVFGIYFNRYFSGFSWITILDLGKNIINDECKYCMDTYYGKGKMTELGFSSGLRYTFIKQKSFFIKPFIESDFDYSHIIYKGDFNGGFDGDGIIINNSSNTFGILGRIGLLFKPISWISVTISSSFRYGFKTEINHNEYYRLRSSGISTLTPLQFRLGYLF